MERVLLSILGIQITLFAGINLILNEIAPYAEGTWFFVLWLGLLVTVYAVVKEYYLLVKRRSTREEER